VQDPIGLAEAHRAQDDGLGLQRSGHVSDPAEGRKYVAILDEVMANVTVYTTDPCSFCVRVKQLLNTRSVPFEEINLARDPDGRAELLQRTGMMSFPQVLVDGELIGGFQETLAADQSGRLKQLLTPAA
jgi:glutaredoxin 3